MVHDVWCPHHIRRCSSFFSGGSSVTGSCSTLGVNRGSSVLWFSIAYRDHRVWLTPSNPCPCTLVGKTPSQIGQTSLVVLSMWVQYPPCMDGSSLSCRSSSTGRVPRLQCVRFPLFECVLLECGFTDHGHVVGARLVCLSSFLAPRVPSRTSSPCCSCQPRMNKTPSQIG